MEKPRFTSHESVSPMPNAFYLNRLRSLSAEVEGLRERVAQRSRLHEEVGNQAKGQELKEVAAEADALGKTIEEMCTRIETGKGADEEGFARVLAAVGQLRAHVPPPSSEAKKFMDFRNRKAL